MTKYETTSSDGLTVYRLVVNRSGSITCSCRGNFYRGTCRHARDLDMGLELMARFR